MKGKTIALMPAVAVALSSFVVAGAGSPQVTAFILNARDFEGILVTSSPYDRWDWFTWGNSDIRTTEVENYDDANNVFTQVDENIYPNVFREAGVPSDIYRVWIYQHDESWDRSLETTIGDDDPVRTTFDSVIVGSNWTWLDVGIHDLAENTVIDVKAVGDFIDHGQGLQRRGAFKCLFLATDLGENPPPFVPDGQSLFQPPNVGTFAQNGGSGIVGLWSPFTTTYSDLDGYDHIAWTFFFLDRAPPIASGGLAVAYNQPANVLWLVGGSPAFCQPGQWAFLQTPYVTLSCYHTTVSGAGDTLTVNWFARPEQCFQGGCGENTALGYVIDTIQLSDFRAVGTWTLHPAGGHAREMSPAPPLAETNLEQLRWEIDAWLAEH